MRRPTEIVAIYFAEGLTSGLLKIGSTGCIPERMKALANTVEPVALLASMAAPLSMEAELHERFSALRVAPRGREWFRDDGSIRAFVDALPEAQRGRVVFAPNTSRGGRQQGEKYPRTSSLLWPLAQVNTPAAGIAARVRSLRLAAGLSLAELTRRAKLKGASHVSMIEKGAARGRGLSMATVIALSDALGCSPEYLTDGRGESSATAPRAA